MKLCSPSLPVLLVLLMAAAAFAQDWTPVPLGSVGDILAIQQTTSPEHWLTGRAGLVARSNADHTVWTLVDVGTSADLFSVVEPAVSQVWVGAGGGVVRYLDNGVWAQRDIPDAQDFVLHTRVVGEALAVGSQGAIYHGTDYGQTWTPESSGTQAALHGATGVTTGPAWAVGDDGLILKLESGATQWIPRVSGTTADLLAIAENLNLLFVVGQGGTILRSADGGASWSPRMSATEATLRAISVSKNDFNVMVAVGDEGVILKSVDRGETWCRLSSMTTARFNAVEAVSTMEYLVAGEGGLLLRTTTGGGDCQDPLAALPLAIPGGLRLSAPSPQPATARVAFELDLDRDGSYAASLIDMQGRVLREVFRGRSLAAGRHPLQVDTSELPAGVYLLQVRTGDASAARRFVVLH